MKSAKWVHEALWVPKVQVFYWPWAKSLRFNIFKLLFLNNRYRPIEAKFHVTSLEWGNESMFNWSRSHDQDGRKKKKKKKKTSKVFFSGIKRPMTLKLCMQYRVLSTTKFIQMMTLCWSWHILRQYQIWSLMFFLLLFSETIVVYDIKVGRWSQLMSTWSLMSNNGQGHSLT